METAKETKNPKVGVLVGSASDLEVLNPLFETLGDFQIQYEVAVISAHRTPELLHAYTSAAAHRGIKVIIAAAGLSAALPGVVAASCDLPVIGLPVQTGPLNGIDALLSITQMPPGVPVASVGINGAKNAALFAVRILSLECFETARRLEDYKKAMKSDAAKKGLVPSEKGLPTWDGSTQALS